MPEPCGIAHIFSKYLNTDAASFSNALFIICPLNLFVNILREPNVLFLKIVYHVTLKKSITFIYFWLTNETTPKNRRESYCLAGRYAVRRLSSQSAGNRPVLSIVLSKRAKKTPLKREKQSLIKEKAPIRVCVPRHSVVKMQQNRCHFYAREKTAKKKYLNYAFACRGTRL